METWKQIKDYNYEASSEGQIRNISTGRILKQRIDKRSGYRIIDIKIDKKNKTFKSHRLIAETFLGEGEDGYNVDHINRVRDDNRVKNLRWVTPSENNLNREYKVSKGQISDILEAYTEGNTIDEIYNIVNKVYV